MFATHRDVRLEILEPDTPGGFMPAIACRPASRSATADAMMRHCARYSGSNVLPSDVHRVRSEGDCCLFVVTERK